MTTSCIFISFHYVTTFWYSHLLVLVSQLIQSKSELNKRFSTLKTQYFRADSFWISANQCCILQFWTALAQRNSELISSKTALISADVFHDLWISAEKCQMSETALFSTIYFWSFNSAYLPGLTAMVKHDDYAMTWNDHGDSSSPWYDYGKIMSWLSWNIAWSGYCRHGK